MATASGLILCQQCAKKDKSEADWFCMDCQINLCHQCLQSHKNVPLLQNHKFRSCTAPGPTESDGKHNKEQLMELMHEKLWKNINNEKPARLSEHSHPNEPSKILASQTTLVKMVKGIQIEKKSTSIRHIKGSFTQIIGNSKHVKTVHNLMGKPYRLGFVNNHIWIRCVRGGEPMKIAVYDTDLSKIKEIEYDDDTEIGTAYQINQTDVFIGTDGALYVFNIDGEILYKVLDGWFSDIMSNNDGATAIDYKNNKLIKLTNRNNKWQKSGEFTVEGENIKTIHEINSNIFVSVNWGQKIYKYSSQGKLLHTYGTGEHGSLLGQFYTPNLCGSDDSGSLIVADLHNNRFQILSTQGMWQEVHLHKITHPSDILVIDNSLYILHGEHGEKLSKYSI